MASIDNNKNKQKRRHDNIHADTIWYKNTMHCISKIDEDEFNFSHKEWISGEYLKEQDLYYKRRTASTRSNSFGGIIPDSVIEILESIW